MSTIEQVQAEIKNLELAISELKSEIDGFEYLLTEAEFDDFLDEEGVQRTSVGSFYPSDILKNCDPVAYRCAKSNYESNYDLDNCEEYTDMVKDLESLESCLESLESNLESDSESLEILENLKSFLESSESYLESLKAK